MCSATPVLFKKQKEENYPVNILSASCLKASSTKITFYLAEFEELFFIKNIVGSPGLVVMGGESWPEGRLFESQ